MTRRWFAVPLTILVCVPVLAQFRPQRRFTLSAGFVSQAIIKALAQKGFEASDISLLANVVATEQNPVLDIQSMEPLGLHRSTLRLACHTPAACLPFYAIATLPAQSQSPTAALIHHTTTLKPPPTMRAGAHATLSLDNGSALVRMTVVSLERGSTGQTIRVATPDRKRIYRAEIVSADFLKGSF